MAGLRLIPLVPRRGRRLKPGVLPQTIATTVENHREAVMILPRFTARLITSTARKEAHMQLCRDLIARLGLFGRSAPKEADAFGARLNRIGSREKRHEGAPCPLFRNQPRPMEA